MIQRLNIGQFGQLKEKEVLLQPSVNVIYGKNESGKSTLCAFLKAMLYGFAPSRKADVAENEKARYTPWNSETMYGTLEMRVKGGRSVLVERVFKDSAAKSGAKVMDAVTGEEAPDLEPNPGPALFGLSLPAFEKTAFIGQNDYKIEKDEEITNRLSNLMSTMEEEVSASLAKKKLDSLRRYYYTSHGGGIIHEIQKELEGLRKELFAAQEGRGTYESLAARKEELQIKLSEAEAKGEELKRRKLEGAARVTKKEYRQLLETEEEIGRSGRWQKEILSSISNEQGTADADFIAIVRDGLAKSGSHRHLAQEQQERLAKYQAEEEEIVQKIGEFGLRGDFAVEEDKLYRLLSEEVSALEQKTGLLAGLTKEKEALRQSLEEGRDGRFTPYEKYSASELQSAAVLCLAEEKALAGAKGPGGALWLFLFAALSSVAGAVLYFYARQAAAATLLLGFCAAGIAGGVGLILWQTRAVGAKRRILRKKLTEYSAVSAGELEQTAEEYFTYRQERDEVGHKIEQLSYQIELYEAERPHEKMGERTARMEELLERMHCADFSELEQKCERLRGLYRQKEAVSVAVSQIREDFGQCMARSEAALAETLQYARKIFPALTSAGDLEAMVQKTEELLREKERLSFTIEGLQEKKRHILKGRTAEEMEKAAGAAEGEEPFTPEEEAALDQAVADAQEEYLLLTKQHAQLTSQCESYSMRGAEAAALEERIFEKEELLAAATLNHSAAAGAISVIDDAFAQIQRTFAPKLNQLAGKNLSKITSGKYQTLLIDKDYNIHIGDQNGRTFEIGYFSAGTKDQIYLSVRLALLDMLEEEKNKMPLILDDAFAQFDDERLIASLRAIAQIAKERQVILLTCQRREGAVLHKLCGAAEQFL